MKVFKSLVVHPICSSLQEKVISFHQRLEKTSLYFTSCLHFTRCDMTFGFDIAAIFWIPRLEQSVIDNGLII